MKGWHAHLFIGQVSTVTSNKLQNLAQNVTDAKHAHLPPQFRSHHWEYPKGPWERIHIDYAGPVVGTMLFIVIDAYSKWIEVKPTSSSSSAATIEILDELFATYGVPLTVVSNNGTQFTSTEFTSFLQMSGVKYHRLTSPYHPATDRPNDTCKQRRTS